MKVSTHADYWLRQFERNHDFYTTTEEIFPLWHQWELSSRPEWGAAFDLGEALNLLYAGDPPGRSEYFLNRAIAIVDRALAEDKFSNERCKVGFPGNRGEALQTRAYAHALLGRPLREAELRQAVEDRCAWFEQLTPGLWYKGYEDNVLSTARVAMILGDWDLVSSVIPFKYKIKHYREELELLLQLKNRLRDKGQPLPEELATRFTAYFEKVRDPTDHTQEAYAGKARFELGAIYCLHVAPIEPFTWERVIHEIAK